MGQKISELDAATTLDGSELVAVVQDGATVKATAQDIADLGGGGGGGGTWAQAGIWDHSVDGSVATFEVDVTGAEDILVELINVSTSASAIIGLQVSGDGGSTWITASYNDVAADGSIGTKSLIGFHTGATTSTRYGSILIPAAQLMGQWRQAICANRGGSTAISPALSVPINRVRVTTSVGGTTLENGKIIAYSR
jgi:hypothetical protein